MVSRRLGLEERFAPPGDEWRDRLNDPREQAPGVNISATPPGLYLSESMQHESKSENSDIVSIRETNQYIITASLVVYNSPISEVSICVECVMRAKPAGVWILFNGPDDAKFLELERLFSGNEKIHLKRIENRGYGAGHNIGISEAIAIGSSYHLVLNSDTRWDGDVIYPMVEYMQQHQDVALMGPRTVYPDGSLQYTARMLPHPAQLFLRRFVPGAFKKTDDQYLLKHLDHNKIWDVPYLLGCFMLFRTSALKEIGMFDERFFMYPEDIDITRRMHKKYKTLYWPEVTIIHDHAQESRKNLRMLRIHMANMVKYFNKWGWLRDREGRCYNSSLKK